MQPILALLVFLASLLLAIGASTWFTRRLETLCDIFGFSTSLLSLLSALGANIPNYAASIVAIAEGQFAIGLGIIVGSNIYNIAIILSVSTFATSTKQGIVLSLKEAQDARLVAYYTLAIMITVLTSVALLTRTLPDSSLNLPSLNLTLLLIVLALTLGLFALLSYHALQREPHPQQVTETSPELEEIEKKQHSILFVSRTIGETLLALLIALGAVVVMVQSGQAFALDVHMPTAIFSLVVLAVATSLPNTAVAFILARTHRATACVEEVLSSNSINATFGIALPLLLWHGVLRDLLLLYLDAPLMVLLTLGGLALILRRRVSHLSSIVLVLLYISWVVVHVFL